MIEDNLLFHFKNGKIWRIYNGYNEDGKYIKNKFLKLVNTNHSENGYKTITYENRNYKQHRLLYEKFHNIILGDDEQIDHINQNKYDNRIENLRIVNNRQNSENRGKNKNNKSGHKNISLHKTSKKWVVIIAGKHIGYFHNLDDAIRKRNEKIQELNSLGHLFSV